VNGSLNECVKAWLRGNLYDIKKAWWGNGQMGNNNMNVWTEKWAFKILRECLEGYNLKIYIELDGLKM